MLIVDPGRGAIVDWVTASEERSETIDFELPLIPVDSDLTANDVDDLLAKAGNWDGGSELIFCLAGFSADLFEGQSNFTYHVRYGPISKLIIYAAQRVRRDC